MDKELVSRLTIAPTGKQNEAGYDLYSVEKITEYGPAQGEMDRSRLVLLEIGEYLKELLRLLPAHHEVVVEISVQESGDKT